MDDVETGKKFKKILVFLKKEWETEPLSADMPHTVGKNLDIESSEAEILLNRLKQRKLVFTPYKENDMFRITDEGITALETTYNPEYQKQLEQKRQIQEKEEKEEKERLEKLEEKRHKDNIKWAKWGVIAAIIVGSIGAITGVISLIISTSK